MESIRELYRFGNGPSSSHTIGPQRAARMFLRRAPKAAAYRAVLFGSLAATGRGHMTDRALEKVFGARPLEIVWLPDRELRGRPNGMRFEALSRTGRVLKQWEAFSVGGGAVWNEEAAPPREAYPLHSMAEALAHAERTGQALWELVEQCEGKGIWRFLDSVWKRMEAAVKAGMEAEGVLPGGLGVARKAHALARKSACFAPHLEPDSRLAVYAYAVAEHNAAGGEVVAAPTCGAAGVVPAVLSYLKERLRLEEPEILRALATAGLVGALVKHNASISGAEVGCQGEIGTACAMAAAAAAQLHGGSPRQVEYAAEMGIEHHLGLTCDPVGGLVQIPCIERNAHAAARALSCCHFALLSDGSHRIPFDKAVAAMKETGQALPRLYRETALGGLAKAWKDLPPAGS